MSLAKMASVDYLVGHVAVGDGRAGDVGASPLTRYYTAEGYPPGTWLGSGMAALGAGTMAGSEVTEEQLRALFEDARNPFTVIGWAGRRRSTRPGRSGSTAA